MLPSLTHQTVQEEPEGMLDGNCHYGKQNKEYETSFKRI